MKKFTTRILPIGFLFMLCFSSNSYGQQSPFISRQAVQFAVSIPVRDMPAVGNVKLGKPGEGGEEKNEKNREIIKHFVPNAKTVPDAALHGMINTLGNVTPSAMTVPGVSFDGNSFPNICNCAPSDANGEVGPNHYIQTVNSVYRIWDKAGNPLTGAISYSTLFAPLGAPCGTSNDGDPIVLYDQLADRWLISEFCVGPTPKHQLIAISQTPNPTGTWFLYDFILPNNKLNDYPHFGMWPDAYYMTDNQFTGNSFTGAGAFAFDRTKMLAGDPTATYIYFDLITSICPSCGGQLPTDLQGTTLPPAGMGNLIMEFRADEYGDPADAYRIFEFKPNFVTPASSTFLQVGTDLVAAPFDPRTPNTRSVIEQPGTAVGLDPIGDRLMHHINYRNLGTPGTPVNSWVLNHTVNVSGVNPVSQATHQAGIRWAELRRVGAAGAMSINQQGTWSINPGNPAGGTNVWMGSVAQNGRGDIVLGYSTSGSTDPNDFPSIRYAGRLASDPLGFLSQGQTNGMLGTGFQNGAASRWGDYSGMSVDPSNDCEFWYTNEYRTAANNGQAFAWSTRVVGGIGFTTSPCAALPVITAGTATLTAEGCVPNNSTIDPGETVTVSFCVTNPSITNTVNLVGTMQATGGVTPISGPQNYGVVVGGGPAVCRSFSFSNTSGTCGATITVSIQLQDGATNLGTVTWTFTLGTTVVSSSQNFDAVVAPALPAGWIATNVAGPAPLWVTSSAGTPAPPAVSLPNAIFIDDPGLVSDKQIVTPSFIPGSGARVSFANNYNLETNWDGGVLEISINGGAYQDIITAGGSFVAGGYIGPLNVSGNPLTGRNAWTGNSGGFITTTVNMPPASAGQPCQLKFRMGSDPSVAAVGWRVDNYSVSQPACCGAACTITCPANITVNTGPGSVTCGANVTFPAAVTTGLCGAVTYSPASGSFFPKGITTVTATTAAGPSCTFTVTVVDNTPPTITCPANITVNNTPGLCSAPVTYPLPTINDNCPFPGGTPTTVTQNSSNTVVAGSASCNAGGVHTDNSYWRAFPLALTGPFTINSVQFGIELANAVGVGTTQPVHVKIYTSAGAFPGGVRTQIGATEIFNVPDQNLSLYTATFATGHTVPANAILVIEIFTPAGGPGNSFFIGSNAAAETAPSYISAAACGIPNPVTVGSLNFPNMHTVINAIGTVPLTTSLITQTAGLPSGGIFPVGVTTNTFSVTDAAGLTSTCSFTVTVVDNQPPAVTCPPNVTRPTDVDLCYATYTPPVPLNSDNCGVTSVTWVMTGATTGASPLTGINYVPSTQFGLNGTTGVGVTTITYTVKDAAGNTTTCSFTVTVNDAQIPVISIQPSNQFVCVGSNGAFTVTATAGGGPLAFKWQAWNGSAWVDIVPAQTAATLPLPSVTFSMNTNSYRVILTGRCSVVTSGFATLYVNPLPTISLLASRSLALLPGQNLTLTAVVSPGGGSYQWFKNGVAIVGATGSSLNNLTVDNIGSYTARYTDLNGCVATSTAMVVTGEPSCKLWVYENPNRGVFQVRFFNSVNEPVTVNIFNSGGAKVYSRAVTTGLAYSSISVDISKEAADTYTVEVINSSGQRGCIGPKKFVMVH